MGVETIGIHFPSSEGLLLPNLRLTLACAWEAVPGIEVLTGVVSVLRGLDGER